ncbi:hypothetical protein ACRAWD_29860 [Caulobacter segnis]
MNTKLSPDERAALLEKELTLDERITAPVHGADVDCRSSGSRSRRARSARPATSPASRGWACRPSTRATPAWA